MMVHNLKLHTENRRLHNDVVRMHSQSKLLVAAQHAQTTTTSMHDSSLAATAAGVPSWEQHTGQPSAEVAAATDRTHSTSHPSVDGKVNSVPDKQGAAYLAINRGVAVTRGAPAVGSSKEDAAMNNEDEATTSANSTGNSAWQEWDNSSVDIKNFAVENATGSGCPANAAAATRQPKGNIVPAELMPAEALVAAFQPTGGKACAMPSPPHAKPRHEEALPLAHSCSACMLSVPLLDPFLPVPAFDASNDCACPSSSLPAHVSWTPSAAQPLALNTAPQPGRPHAARVDTAHAPGSQSVAFTCLCPNTSASTSLDARPLRSGGHNCSAGATRAMPVREQCQTSSTSTLNPALRPRPAFTNPFLRIPFHFKAANTLRLHQNPPNTETMPHAVCPREPPGEYVAVAMVPPDPPTCRNPWSRTNAPDIEGGSGMRRSLHKWPFSVAQSSRIAHDQSHRSPLVNLAALDIETPAPPVSDSPHPVPAPALRSKSVSMSAPLSHRGNFSSSVSQQPLHQAPQLSCESLHLVRAFRAASHECSTSEPLVQAAGAEFDAIVGTHPEFGTVTNPTFKPALDDVHSIGGKAGAVQSGNPFIGAGNQLQVAANDVDPLERRDYISREHGLNCFGSILTVAPPEGSRATSCFTEQDTIEIQANHLQ
jgi:hypothetical protein